MKRSITIVLIIAILINTLFPNFIYASEYGTYDEAQEHQKDGASINDKLWEEGKADKEARKGKSTEDVNDTKSSSNLIANVLCWLITLLPHSINALMTLIVYNTQEDGYSSILGGVSAIADKEFTIENLLLGKYTLFDIDYFKYNTSNNEKNVNSTIKQSVATWYYVLRNISIVISVLVLIYIGIRMAVSTVASEQAKYKKMFTGWVTSFILLFVMQYIFIFLMTLQESLLQIVATWTKGEGFEEAIITHIWDTLKNSYRMEQCLGCY